MSDIPDLQAEIISRTLASLNGEIPEALRAEIVALAESGQFLENGALHALLAKAASTQVTDAD